VNRNLISQKLLRSEGGLRQLPAPHVGELGVITVDKHKRITGINQAVGILLRVQASVFLHRSLSDLLARACPGSDCEQIIEAVQRALTVWKMSVFEIHLPGGEMPATFLKLHVSAMRNHDAREPVAVLTLEDITAYKQVGLSGLAHENARQYTKVLELATKLEQQKEQYRLQSIHDGLTGLYNYAHFQVLLADEVARARRYGHPLALLMLDVDDFKSYNDLYGHPAGNRALRGLATILQNSSRRTDRVARYGGEEFVVVLPETDRREAMVVAGRLRRAVQQGTRTGAEFRRPITVSVGVADYPRDADSPQELVFQADQRLYRAKAAGKNRVCGL